MNEKSIAIITARGGSKRIPGKNIREFCGKPILYYSIQAALDAGIFDEVMVSTDNEEIAEIAKKYGASVPFMRSPETSNDYATTSDVLREVLTNYEKQGEKFGIMACIYPTAPFVTADKLKCAVALLKEKHATSACSVVKFSFPPQRAYVIRNGCLQYRNPEYRESRSQDLETLYHDCGQFYIYEIESFLKGKDMEKRIPIVMSDLEVQDIDNEEDWEIAEIKYELTRR